MNDSLHPETRRLLDQVRADLAAIERTAARWSMVLAAGTVIGFVTAIIGAHLP